MEPTAPKNTARKAGPRQVSADLATSNKELQDAMLCLKGLAYQLGFRCKISFITID